MRDSLNTRDTIQTESGSVTIFRLDRLTGPEFGRVERLPYSLKVILENLLRNEDGGAVTVDDIKSLSHWDAKTPAHREIPFKPTRLLLHDFTGVPAVVDLAAMRDAIAQLGGNPRRIKPLIPVDLVIDHSGEVYKFGTEGALKINADREFARNHERYEFLRWAERKIDNFRVIPPATGIIHQVNLELLATVVVTQSHDGARIVMPDTLLGTDSHTPMINGLGVVGWGVGGIEAEAVMLGQPAYLLMPEVVGLRLTGRLRAGATATDLVLTITEKLREKGVVGKFVEYYGDGVAALSLPDRATCANMSPEYGATMGFFPVDCETLAYLRQTARANELVDLVERYTKEQGLYRMSDTPDPEFSDTATVDLSTVEPSLAGPKRPQDRVPLSNMKTSFVAALRAPVSERGFALDAAALKRTAEVKDNGKSTRIAHGAVVIAAITSCTSTSNPSMMIAAGLVAKKACEKGLAVKPYVKTSLAPGSRVVTKYLNAAKLTPYLQQLNFHTVGFGCTSCIGNSGPLPEPVASAIREGHLVAAAVLSGNRNFEGRVHALTKANYLASPPLVVAYAIAGTVDIDLTSEALGTGSDGSPVYLKDIWPTDKEIADLNAAMVKPEDFRQQYEMALRGDERWNRISGPPDDTYQWSDESTYVRNPPFFDNLTKEVPPLKPITGARCLVILGDSVTTDHISPAGAIEPDSPAGMYLQKLGIRPGDFNSYGSRRGNDRVMTRGTFANIRLRNRLAPGTEGGFTTYLPSEPRRDRQGAGDEVMTIFEAAQRYQADGTPLLVIAGREYGTGSSRDWAAKGTLLLGIKAVIAESFERIHRSNLVGMGVLPLQFRQGETPESLGITGWELFDFPSLNDDLQPMQEIEAALTDPKTGKTRTITLVSRLDTPIEVDYFRNGGILPTVLRKLAAT